MTQTPKPPEQAKPSTIPEPPASAFAHVEQTAQVSCSVDGQRLDPVLPEQEQGETMQAFTERRSEFLDAYDRDPDMRCTVTRVIIWPNGQVQREVKQISARCKYKEVRKYQQDSEAAAKAAGF